MLHKTYYIQNTTNFKLLMWFKELIMHECLCVWRSEANVQESVLSYYVVLELRSEGMVAGTFNTWAIFLAWCLMFGIT